MQHMQMHYIDQSIWIIIDEYKLVDTLRLLNCIMVYIENDSSRELQSRNIDFFNNRNVCPSIGYSCNKTPEKLSE